MEFYDYETLRKLAFEKRIEEIKSELAKKGATQDEIDEYVYSLRAIEELNDKYFAN
jgi:hypothetical protein